MPTTFNVISLGVAADMDTVDGNTDAENAAALVGTTFGSPGAPLVDHFVSFSAGTGGFSGGQSGYYDQTNSPSENFSIDGGPDQVFDSVARFLATVTYTDGTTASVNVAVFQDTAGNTYLAPEMSLNATQMALEAAPIQSLTLNSLAFSTTHGLVASREGFNYVTCYTPQMRLTTPTGPRRVETLKVGDALTTYDGTTTQVRWMGHSQHLALGAATPVRIVAGALGPGLPERDLVISQQHRVLLVSPIAERMFGQPEVFVRAKHLVGFNGITFATEQAMVTYVHVLCARHEVLLAEGSPSESLLPGAIAARALGAAAMRQMTRACPGADRLTLARPVIQGPRLRRLLQRHTKNQQPLVARSRALA